MRRVNKTNIKNPQAKIKCEYWTVVKQKPIGSGPIYSAVQVGGARSELHAVQCGGRGSEPNGLALIVRSAANFRNKMARMLLAVLFLQKPTDNTEAVQ